MYVFYGNTVENVCSRVLFVSDSDVFDIFH
jgi:hypothetical protein